MNKIGITLGVLCITFKLLSMEGNSSGSTFSCEAKRQELTTIKCSLINSLKEIEDFNQKATKDTQKFSQDELELITITQEVLPILPTPILSHACPDPVVKLLLEIEGVAKTMVPFSAHMISLRENSKVDDQMLTSLGSALRNLVALHKEVSDHKVQKEK